jgi:hypothetical protein
MVAQARRILPLNNTPNGLVANLIFPCGFSPASTSVQWMTRSLVQWFQKA